MHYAIEAWGLGTFMLVAGTAAVALGALPAPLESAIAAHPIAGRALFGAAMGLTAMAIVYSPWGARSGAHLNPAVTLTMASLKKMQRVDAIGYALAQFAGGAIGFAIVAALAGPRLLGPPAYAIVTKPGQWGPGAAFAGELTIALILMSVLLRFMNAPPRFARFTGVAAGVLVALFITFEAPLSGMSLNPARTFASALIGGDWTAIWIYFTAPPLGMLLAAVAYIKFEGTGAALCGRLNHTGPYPCIFNCTYRQRFPSETVQPRGDRVADA